MKVLRTQWGEDGLLNKWCWGRCTFTGKRMTPGSYLTPYKTMTQMDRSRVCRFNP